jgi:hypothetical protein
MILFLIRRAHVVLLVIFAGCMACGGAAAAVAQETSSSPTGPSLTLTAATSANQASETVTVVGQDFSVGGRVYLAVYDQMGAKLYESRWVIASYASTYEPYWSEGQYGGTISTPGGTLLETFDGLCGANVMMRALDEGTNRWSNWLEVGLTCAVSDEVVLESTTP